MTMEFANQRKMMARIEELQNLCVTQAEMLARLEKAVDRLEQNGCAVTNKQASKKAA